jgi:predicted lipoprotein
LFDAGVQATLAAFTSDSLASARRAYLKGLADNLESKAREVHGIWSSDGGDYGRQLAASTATGIQDPMGLVVNAMIAMLEEVTKTKIGKPFGKFDLGILQPELVESFRANVSLPLIRANMVALESMYNGSSTSGLDQALDDLHALYGEDPLSTTITQAFTASIQALDQITLPLQDAMIGQHAQVEAAYQALKALVILFKTDLCSAMNLTVTVSDADGD